MTSNVAAVLQSGNLFVYTMHNPVRFIDPTGLWGVEYQGAGPCLHFMLRHLNGRSQQSIINSFLEVQQQRNHFEPGAYAVANVKVALATGSPLGFGPYSGASGGHSQFAGAGGGFQFEPGSTATQQAAFANAIVYLMGSTTAATYIRYVMNSSETTVVRFTEGGRNNYWSRYQTGSSGRIEWDPTHAPRVGESRIGQGRTAVMSPAVVLFHEIVHAWQDLSGLFFGNERAFLEDHAWYRESIVAGELGEPQRRFYGDNSGHVTVNDPTAWGSFEGRLGSRRFVRHN